MSLTWRSYRKSKDEFSSNRRFPTAASSKIPEPSVGCCSTEIGEVKIWTSIRRFLGGQNQYFVTISKGLVSATKFIFAPNISSSTIMEAMAAKEALQSPLYLDCTSLVEVDTLINILDWNLFSILSVYILDTIRIQQMT